MELKKDHYDKLPSVACEILDGLIEKYSEEENFEKAWAEYRSYVLKTRTDLLRMPGYIFKNYIDIRTKKWKLPEYVPEFEMKHVGVLGMHWGVRKAKADISTPRVKRVLSEKQKDSLKVAGGVAAGLAIGAVAVGAAWYLKNAKTKKILQQAKRASIAKGLATKAARRASGAYQVFKGVDVTISRGAELMKAFSNVKIAKILA